MSEPLAGFDVAVPFLLLMPVTLRLRKKKLEADQSNLAKTPENVRSHVALRAKIQELDFWLQILSSDMSLKDLMAWGPEEEASSPAPATESSSPAAWRCSVPECEGHDHAVQVFHGVCYRCLHVTAYPHRYQENNGYRVKIWLLPSKTWHIFYAAIAGRMNQAGEWFGAGLPVAHMDFAKAVELAVFEAEKQKKEAGNV